MSADSISIQTVGAIVNPVSGSGNAKQMYGDLVHRLSDRDVRKRVTADADDVPVAVREQADADVIASIGGDGTLREVVATLVDLDDPPPVLVVPAGRGNSAYRHLYGDTDWREVVGEVAVDPAVAPLDVGIVDADPPIADRHFVLGFTAGLFRSAVSHAEALDLLPGPLAYLLATGWAVLGDDPVRGTLAVDGEEVYSGDARLLAVGGGRYRGQDFELFPASHPGDGQVYAIAIEPAGVRGSLALVRYARANRLHEHPAVHHASGDQVTITSAGGLPVEMDGTALETPITDANISMLDDAVTYLRPASRDSSDIDQEATND